MIKRTVYFGNPAYLSVANRQLVVKIVQADLPSGQPPSPVRTLPIEDLGVVVLDNQRITVTQGVLDSLLENNVALIVCDKSHMPVGLHLPLDGNTLQSERFRYQIGASVPLKKQLWQQTVQAKLRNQSALLAMRGIEHGNMDAWIDRVRSGDPDNFEARAAAYYWRNLFHGEEPFVRDRYGEYPNNLLNYGYAILRALVARALVVSGMLPTLGIHHRNRYNAYCLADDIMEPYRPFVDSLVVSICDRHGAGYCGELTKEIKTQFLQIPVMDVVVDGSTSPLMNGVARTATSLMKCFSGELRRVAYPVFPSD